MLVNVLFNICYKERCFMISIYKTILKNDDQLKNITMIMTVNVTVTITTFYASSNDNFK